MDGPQILPQNGDVSVGLFVRNPTLKLRLSASQRLTMLFEFMLAKFYWRILQYYVSRCHQVILPFQLPMYAIFEQYLLTYLLIICGWTGGMPPTF